MSALYANPQIAIQNIQKKIGHLIFNQFELFKPPLLTVMIKMVAAQYFESLITAVEFLHDHSVAHLDLRIENLCVSGTMDNFYVVIIHLDRSDKLSHISTTGKVEVSSFKDVQFS